MSARQPDPHVATMFEMVLEISLLRSVVRELVHQSPVTDGRSLTVDDLDLLSGEREAFERALAEAPNV